MSDSSPRYTHGTHGEGEGDFRFTSLFVSGAPTYNAVHTPNNTNMADTSTHMTMDVDGGGGGAGQSQIPPAHEGIIRGRDTIVSATTSTTSTIHTRAPSTTAADGNDDMFTEPALPSAGSGGGGDGDSIRILRHPSAFDEQFSPMLQGLKGGKTTRVSHRAMEIGLTSRKRQRVTTAGESSSRSSAAIAKNGKSSTKSPLTPLASIRYSTRLLTPHLKAVTSCIHLLRDRETNSHSMAPSAHANRTRRFHRVVFPNTKIDTLSSDQFPACHICKFTPDGQYLICVSRSLRRLLIYRYNSFGNNNISRNGNGDGHADGKSFGSFFTLHSEKRLAVNSRAIMKSNVVFFSSDYVIMCTVGDSVGVGGVPQGSEGEGGVGVGVSQITITPEMSVNQYTIHSPQPSASTSASQVHPGLTTTTLDYTFHLINVRQCKEVSRVSFLADYIFASFASSVCVYGDMFGVLSTKHQLLHLFRIEKRGRGHGHGGKGGGGEGEYCFIFFKKVGHSCFDDDALFERVSMCVGEGEGVSMSDELKRYESLMKKRKRELELESLPFRPPPPRATTIPTPTSISMVAPPAPLLRSRTYSHELSRMGEGEGEGEGVGVMRRNHSQGLVGLVDAEGAGTHVVSLRLPAAADTTTATPPPPPPPGIISGLKHKILVFLYKQALENNALHSFRLNFEAFNRMLMSRFQFVSDGVALVKLGSPALSHHLSSSTLNAHPWFIVAFNVYTCEILNILEGSSEHLFNLWNNYADYLRHGSSLSSSSSGTPSLSPSRFISSSQNVPLLRYYTGKQWRSVCSGRGLRGRHKDQEKEKEKESGSGSGKNEVLRRINSVLPMSCQVNSPTPYLDQKLFNFDGRLISNSERAPSCTVETPIEFYAANVVRGEGVGDGKSHPVPLFKLYPSPPNMPHTINTMRLIKRVRWIFHPYHPIVISNVAFSRLYTDYNAIHFHET